MKTIALRCLHVSLAFLLAINTAAAGRWLRGCWEAPAACPMPCVTAPACESVCGGCEPVTCHEPVDCCGAGAVSQGGFGETVIHSSVPTATYEPTIAAEPTPAMPPAPTEVYEPAPATGFDGGFRSDNVAPVDNDPPSDDWDSGISDPPQQLATEELPPLDDSDDFGGFDEPVEEEPTDDLFADEPAMPEAPAEEPVDDLFGAEPVEEPTDELFGDDSAEDAMDGGDDLFGAEEPAADDSGADAGTDDDLFGEPMADEPVDDLFGAEPVEEPATEESNDDLFGTDEGADDDLFGDTPEEPSFDEAADDLFGDSPADAPADAEPADDLFGDDGFDEEMPAEEAVDDLFGDEGFDAPAADEAPADAMPADDVPDTDTEEAFDDLFGGFGAILREPGGVDSARGRTWVDNTGRFSTVGRLIAIDGSAIRIEKQSGTIATVSLTRLSQGDLEFVSRQSLAQHQVREAIIARGGRPAADQPKQASTAAPLRTAQL